MIQKWSQLLLMILNLFVARVFIESLFSGIVMFSVHTFHISCSTVLSVFSFHHIVTFNELFSLVLTVRSSHALHFLASLSLLHLMCVFVCTCVFVRACIHTPLALNNNPFSLCITLSSSPSYQFQISIFVKQLSLTQRLLHYPPSSMGLKSSRDPFIVSSDFCFPLLFLFRRNPVWPSKKIHALTSV
jgi:hypothetical protein